MSRSQRDAKWKRPGAIVVAGATVMAIVGLTALALAKAFTLKVASSATVTNIQGTSKHEPIVINSGGFAVYELFPETARHILCTHANGCFRFWLPVMVRAGTKVTKAPGIRGRLGILHRGRLVQVTLDGHPLYTFVFDKHARDATGQGIHSFGGVWHVVTTGKPTGTTTTTTSSSRTTTTTTTTSSYPYPIY